MGDTDPSLAKTWAAVGGLVGVDMASEYLSQLRWRRQGGELRVGDDTT